MPERANPVKDGRAARWEGQRERRRAEFVEAAIAAIEEHGPDVLTEQIAAQAGVPRPRLYRHFDGKADLQQAVCRRILERLTDDLSPIWHGGRSPVELITSVVDTIVHWLTTHSALYRYLARHSAGSRSGSTQDRSDALTDFTGTLAVRLSRLLQTVLETAGRDARGTGPLAFGVVAFAEAAIGRWLAKPERLTAEEFGAGLVRGIWTLIEDFLAERGINVDPDAPLPKGLAASMLDPAAPAG
jgi:AcrR family transcriptional regulator